MSDELDSLTDQQLNDVLSLLLPVPAHRWVETTSDSDECEHCGRAKWQDERPCCIWWTSNVAEVLALLDRISPDWSSRTYGNQTVVGLSFVGIERGEARGIGPTLARAGVVAAVRALRYDLAATAKAKDVALCGRCGAEMRPNVPRLGWTAGAVHKTSGRLTCADQAVEAVSYTTP